MDSPRPDPSQLWFESVRVRRSIIASYWLVIILAIPLWWKITSIERLSLPASRVFTEAKRKQEVLFPVTVNLEANDGGHSALVAAQVQSLLQQGSGQVSSPIDISVTSNDSTAAYHVVLNQGSRDTQSFVPVVRVKGRHLYINTSPENEDLDTIATHLADTLNKLLAPYETYHASHTQARRVMPYSSRYRLAFSLLNEDAASGNGAFAWDVQNAIQKHLSPLMDKLSLLHNFTIESQVQFHAPLAFEPKQVQHDGIDVHGLTQEDLTVFINSAEWTLSSSVSNDPVIHFVLFIPSSKHSPLHILDNEGSVYGSNAFLLPQWGGIVLLNPSQKISSSSASQPHHLAQSDLNPVFKTFGYQLLSLLGVPGLPRSVESYPHPHEDGAPSEPFTDWELDALLRRRAIENVWASADTLASIVRLVDQIESMPVGQDVRGDIQGALSALNEVHETSRSSVVAALQSSARALTLASRAFFNPGMLALLYFPAEHKYAVYTPLFASVAAPLVGAVVRELTARRRARKAAREQAAQRAAGTQQQQGGR